MPSFAAVRAAIFAYASCVMSQPTRKPLMSTALLETYDLPLLDAAASPDEQIRWQVRELLAGLFPTGPFERRGEQRFPYPRLIQLLPTTAEGTQVNGQRVIVSGKHISESGLSFFHPEPLAHRLVIATLEKADRTKHAFLLDVDWCRFTHHGWYESGGKFLRTVDLAELKR